MQFIVLGYDGKDEKAPGRRLAMRDAHLEGAKAMFARGSFLYASAILSDEGAMRGSLIVCDFPSREALRKQWLDSEPYVTGKVWDRIEVHRAQVAPFLADEPT